MVAPHDTGKLIISLVRIPGSGYDKITTAGSKCLDLSRVSSLASPMVDELLPFALVMIPPLNTGK